MGHFFIQMKYNEITYSFHKIIIKQKISKLCILFERTYIFKLKHDLNSILPKNGNDVICDQQYNLLYIIWFGKISCEYRYFWLAENILRRYHSRLYSLAFSIWFKITFFKMFWTNFFMRHKMINRSPCGYQPFFLENFWKSEIKQKLLNLWIK